MSRVETAVAPIYPPDAVLERQRAARVLWASVHGITSLSTANKLANVTTEAAALLVSDLINNYLAGVAVKYGRLRRQFTSRQSRTAPPTRAATPLRLALSPCDLRTLPNGGSQIEAGAGVPGGYRRGLSRRSRKSWCGFAAGAVARRDRAV